MKEEIDALRFREGMERLEDIIKGLEGGELELEDALERYEEGLRLYRRLGAILADAEKRIEVLSGEKAGKLRWTTFEAPTNGEEGEIENE